MLNIFTSKNRYARFFIPLLLILLVLISYVIYSLYIKSLHSIQRSEQLTKNIHQIIYFDEALTMSARMAVLTGDKHWIQRYDELVPKLYNLIQESINSTPQINSYLQAVDEANQKLVSAELQSFKLLNNGKKTEAKDLLFNQEYLANKKIYTNGVNQARQLMKEDQNRLIADIKNDFLISIAIVVILLIINLVFGKTIFSYFKNSNAKLHSDIFDSKQKLNALYELSPLDIALTDMNGKYLDFNNAFEKICGYTREELNKLDYWQLTPKKYEKNEAIQLKTLKETGFYGPYEKEYIQKNGSLIDIRLNGMTITDLDNNHYIWSIVEDISDQKAIHKQLVKAKEDAENANRYKSEFLANMSHEIRTPMTGILGFVNHLKKSETDPDKLKDLNVISASGNTLLNIINDILDFSKIESGKLDLELHQIEPYQILTETSSTFKELLDAKHITFTRNYDDNIPKYILGDEVRLKQVIFNLLSNAIKFTPATRSITLEAKYINKEKLYIAISDTGIGIVKEKLDQIFEAFKQEDASTTRKYGGTGLGLSISSRLVQMMHGEIKVESVLGEGSKFYFEIPITIPDTVKTHRKESLSKSSDAMVSFQGNILIVEDNKTNQMLLGIILDELNITYEIANDGVEAVKMYQEKPYDLILMDENMPNMNGIEATRQIRLIEKERSSSPTPIVAVTANALTQDRQRFLDAGMDEYLSKPYEEKDIVQLLTKYLA